MKSSGMKFSESEAAKTAIVTGGGKGIGRAISESLAKAGWNLVLLGRDRDALTETARQIEAAHRVRVETRSVDLSELSSVGSLGESSVEKVFSEWKSAAELPRALVCNAGNYGTLGNLSSVDLSEWKRSFDL